MDSTVWDSQPEITWGVHPEDPFGHAAYIGDRLVRLFNHWDPDCPSFSDPDSWRVPLSGALRSIDFDIAVEIEPPSWLVKGIFPASGIGLLYGESGAGKTFLAVHAAMCVARGFPFFGRRVKPGGVLYIAAEGGTSVYPRFRAANDSLSAAIAAKRLCAVQAGSGERAPLKIVIQAPDLSPDGDVTPLINTIQDAARAMERAGSRLALIVVDTWHSVLGGADENAAADAGHALRPFKEAAERLGAFTLIVHHPGKDVDKGARGSSSLAAAVDTSIELRVPRCVGPTAKPGSMIRQATIIKQRDGGVGDLFHYQLPVTQLGVDEDGDPWTTCTVQPSDPPIADDGLSKGDRHFMDAVQAAITEQGGESGKFEVARLRFFNLLGQKAASAKRQAWNRALKAGREAGRIETDDHDLQIWIPRRPEACDM